MDVLFAPESTHEHLSCVASCLSIDGVKSTLSSGPCLTLVLWEGGWLLVFFFGGGQWWVGSVLSLVTGMLHWLVISLCGHG